MASLRATCSPQLSASKASLFVETKALSRTQALPLKRTAPAATVCMAGAPAYYADISRRNIMNLALAGAVALPSVAVIGGWAFMLVPPSSGGSGGGVVARDANGADVLASAWLKTHTPGDRSLAEGLKGDATYLVVEDSGSLAPYGVNAVCTHLGCVVPYNRAENKFICPCHGSQYDSTGKVVRGPAPLSLALAHVDVDDDKVVFSPWTETDFRTGEAPWWS